jgi:Kelch motif
MLTSDTAFEGCLLHKEKYKHYCTKCKQFVCIKCIGINHFGHGIIFDYMMSPLRNSNDKIDIISKHIEQIGVLKNDIQKALDNTIKDLQTMKQNLHKSNEIMEALFTQHNVDDSVKSIMLSTRGGEGDEKSDIMQYMTAQYEIKSALQSSIQQIIAKYHASKLIEKNVNFINFIHSFTNNSSTIALYEPLTKIHKVVTMPTVVPDQVQSVTCENRIFLNGGYVGGIYQNTMKEYDQLKYDLVNKAAMSTPRTRHSLASVIDESIVVCGGYNGSQTGSCEKYSLASDSWASLPALIQARDTSGLCFHDNKSLYIFCGYFSSYRIKSCEKLDLFPKVASSWVNIVIDEGSSGWNIRDALHCSTISQNSILCFGGNDGSISNKCFIVKIVSDSSIKIEAAPCTLVNGAEFVFSTTVLSDNEKLYTVDNARNLHIFDISNSKWEFISKASWYC